MYKKYSCDVRDIFFSGFWSQGDGASFTGGIFIKDYLEATKQKSKYKEKLEQILKECDEWGVEYSCI